MGELADAYYRQLIETGAIALKDPASTTGATRRQSSLIFEHGAMLFLPDSRRSHVNAVNDVLREFPSSAVLVNIDLAHSQTSSFTNGVFSALNKMRQIYIKDLGTTTAERGLNERAYIPPDIKPDTMLIVVSDVYEIEDETTLLEHIKVARDGIKDHTGPIHLVVGIMAASEDGRKRLEEHGISPHWVLTEQDIVDRITATK